MIPKRIAIMTSGGDAPGMNAALRAADRMAEHLGLVVFGIEDGYEGLLAGRIVPLGPKELDGIERRGGTILGTSRSAQFRTPEGLQRGLDQLQQHRVDGVVII